MAALAPPPGGRWTGLETGCAACHEDVHRGELDRDCAACHDAGEWERAPRFDHDRTRYRLTGAHDSVSCEGCHRPGPGRSGVVPAAAATPRPVYRNLAFGECSSCHADPHAGRFGGKCASCHVTSDFGRIDRDAFDHERTRYPLRGEHALVACAKCHAPGEAGKRPPFQQCGSCHRLDPHAGAATLAGQKVDCGACHGVGGWTPGTTTIAQHARSRYPLEGRHRQVACAACHRQLPAAAPGAAEVGQARVQLRPAFARCRDCHADDHGSQLAARRDGGACEACHQVAGWAPSTFGRSDHAALRLALDGRHAEATCDACHAAAPKGLPP
ncbi:MAG TPA: hypothetical protein VFX50_09540, partial [Gemmatimonadales bacterium]|nr:hypothetical protein [Gemmatimonadales bacterium]